LPGKRSPSVAVAVLLDFLKPSVGRTLTPETVVDMVLRTGQVRSMQSTTPPTISIVIPSYNCEDTILGTIESARRSLSFCERVKGVPVDYSIVVVDDGSTDCTVKLIERHYDPADRIAVVKNPRNRGAGYSRNEGVRRTNGEYIFFLDSDDLFLDAHIHACLSRIIPAINCGYVRTQVLLADDIHPGWHNEISASIPITLCVRRRSHEYIGGFLEDSCLDSLRMEDVCYQRLLSAFFQYVMLPERTVYYSRRPGNALDRQIARFRRPPNIAADVFSDEERAAFPEVQQLLQRRVQTICQQKGQARV
jgi:glycosyltransferase involved in cell wall biosynthesis